jgi:hypothetical protein
VKTHQHVCSGVWPSSCDVYNKSVTEEFSETSVPRHL